MWSKTCWPTWLARKCTETFDGHASCYIESGFNKGVLIDFSYDVEPLPGAYPVPVLGPFSLLKETTINHWGKLFFRYMYWYMMMQGIDIPLPSAIQYGRQRTIGSRQRKLITICIRSRRNDNMATKTIAGKTVQVNDEGFMTNPAEWTKDIAVEMAKEEGIDELTEAHWKVIDFCRQKRCNQRRSFPHPAHHHQRQRHYPPKNCSLCSPKVLPRKSPAFLGWANPKAVSNRIHRTGN